MKQNTTRKRRGIWGKLSAEPVRARLSENEWNFFYKQRVSDAELAACRLWEYARESNSIRDMARIDPDWNPFYREPFPDPWQSLTTAQRRKLSLLASVQLRVSPFRVISAAVPWSGKQARQNWLVTPDGTQRIVNKDGVEVLCAEIDWQTCTDKQILQSFGEWVKANRPRDIGKPTKRGHDPDELQASLERLGIMRLMHCHSFDEIGEIVPAEWLDKEKYSTKAECLKERHKAIDDFHSLFPFLPNENPIPFEALPGAW
jgi:hypothetical protein